MKTERKHEVSEIAQLRQQIELECEALQRALYGYAVVASHEVITRRYEALAVYKDELEKLVGKDEANRVLYEAYSAKIG
jgi:hypothetical protein